MVEPPGQLGEVPFQAPAGVGVGRMDRLDRQPGQAEEPVDLVHGADQPAALAGREGAERVGGGLVRAPVHQGQLVEAPGGQPRLADPIIVRRGLDPDQVAGDERLDQAAQVPRVESQSRSKRSKLGSPLTDLVEHPGLAQGAVASEEPVFEGAGSLGHQAIEAPDGGDVGRVHRLTLVRSID